MSNFRPASVNDDDDNENENNPLLWSIPYRQLRQPSRLREFITSFLGTRLQSATITLLMGCGRLQRFGSRLLLDTRELLRALKTYARENPKQFTMICTGIILVALACATPAILGAIGFSAVGPVAGSIAAGWQASMGSAVAGSSFAFLQSAAMGGAAFGLFAGVGALGGLVAVGGVGASVAVVKAGFVASVAVVSEKILLIGEAVGENVAGAGEVMKNQAVQFGGAMAVGGVRFGGGVADAAVQVGHVVGGWWGKVTRKVKGE